MQKFRELKVWQRAMDFTIEIYRESRAFPADERFGLTSQLRRATAAIPSNIAEGAGNTSKKEFTRFLEIALRSSYEVMTAMEIARGLNYFTNENADALLKQADEIAAMLVSLMKALGWSSN